MECNKEDAFRVKRIAEKKMENKDFLRARKIAIQAQKLYPELENISQLIMVCDVHCSAENKVHGTEMDWYGILKVEPTADDLLVRKQSRKFGLFLHPHKNKFPGAVDAFRLIGEAQSVLLDQEKRWIYDMKCISAAVNVQQQTGHVKSSVSANKQLQQALQADHTGSKSSRPTFWTACPFCSMRHRYYRDMLKKNVSCQNCGKSFIGTDISTPGVASHNSWSLLAVPKQTEADNQAPSEVDQQSNAENSTKIKAGENSWSSDTTQGDVSENCNQKRKAEAPQPCGKMNEKKRKQVSESSKSCNSNRPTFWTACPSCYVLYQFCRNMLHRNLCCQKVFTAYEIGTQGVAPKTNSSQPAFLKQTLAPNQAPSGSLRNVELATTKVEIGRNIWSSEDDKNQAEQKKRSDSHVHLSMDEEDQKLQYDASMFEIPTEDAGVVPDFPEVGYEIPVSEFYNFDANKFLEKFEIGQVWAFYCDEDGMPKYYGRIKKIDILPKYRLTVAWLGVSSISNDMIQWIDKYIPITCGKFKLKKRKPREYTNIYPFSHQVSVRVESRGTKEEYVILPRKGEIWALYKSWNAGLKCSDLGTCDYDVLEVRKLNQIPAFRLTEERGGSLRGYLELDPAALPLHWFSKD